MHVPLSVKELNDTAREKAKELGLLPEISFECWVNPHLLARNPDIPFITRSPYLQL